MNPLIIYTVDPENPATLWEGYGYDSHDVPGLTRLLYRLDG
jgi:hypothetical protein